MNHALHVFVLLAVFAYAIVIFAKGRLSANQYLAADMLMGAALVALIVEGKRSALLCSHLFYGWSRIT